MYKYVDKKLVFKVFSEDCYFEGFKTYDLLVYS